MCSEREIWRPMQTCFIHLPPAAAWACFRFSLTFPTATHLYVCLHFLFMSPIVLFIPASQTEASEHRNASCVVSSRSARARATTSTALRQLREKRNLFDWQQHLTWARIDVLFIRVLLNPVQAKCRMYVVLHKHAVLVHRINKRENQSRGGGDDQAKGTYLYVWMHPICTLDAFVGALSLNHKSTAMFNTQYESLMLLVQSEQRNAIFWCQHGRTVLKAIFRMQEYIPEKCVQH